MLTIGASHRTATSAMLSDFGRAAQEFRASVRDGMHGGSRLPVHELAVLATCARVEVYAVTEESAVAEALSILGREVFGVSERAYRFQGTDAVRHLCRVAAGVESFVVGEHEIAGQVQRAFRDAALGRGDTGVLERAAAVARRASRRVRSETSIGRYPASVSSVAVDLIRDRLGDLTRSRAVVVGAGHAGLLVARSLKSAGVASLVVANRSPDRAREVATGVGGEPAALDRLGDLLAGADVVVTATGADGIVVDVSTTAAALESRDDGRPLLLLDLALPGDVHPEVGRMAGVELLTLEDVKTCVHRHISLRRGELGRAERVIDEVVDDFIRQQDVTDVEALIGELRRSVEEVRAAEVERWLAAQAQETAPSREELDRLTRSIVNKLLHDPMKRLRSAAVWSRQGRYTSPTPTGG
jgi:glutamyl-tRNA reductase